MAEDKFYNGVNGDNVGIENPAVDAFAITPSDTADVKEVTRAIYVGGDSDIAVVMKSGASVTLHSVVAGTMIPIRVSRVLATGTTATNLVGLV